MRSSTDWSLAFFRASPPAAEQAGAQCRRRTNDRSGDGKADAAAWTTWAELGSAVRLASRPGGEPLPVTAPKRVADVEGRSHANAGGRLWARVRRDVVVVIRSTIAGRCASEWRANDNTISYQNVIVIVSDESSKPPTNHHSF